MEGRTKSSGFKMKAGAEGPMKKNFPSTFKHRVPKGSTHEPHADEGTGTTTGPRGSLSSYSNTSNLTDAEKRTRDVNTLRSNRNASLYGQGGYLSGLDT